MKKYFNFIIFHTIPGPSFYFYDDNPSKIRTIPVKCCEHNAHVLFVLTINAHKIENRNPKKKSTGKNTFFTKVLRPEKGKIKHPPKMAKIRE